jgi:hypothetical protein
MDSPLILHIMLHIMGPKITPPSPSLQLLIFQCDRQPSQREKATLIAGAALFRSVHVGISCCQGALRWSKR